MEEQKETGILNHLSTHNLPIPLFPFHKHTDACAHAPHPGMDNNYGRGPKAGGLSRAADTDPEMLMSMSASMLNSAGYRPTS